MLIWISESRLGKDHDVSTIVVSSIPMRTRELAIVMIRSQRRATKDKSLLRNICLLAVM